MLCTNVFFCRVPTFLGSTENVFELDQFYKYYSDDSGNEINGEA